MIERQQVQPPECRRCGQPVAYAGAIFCGAACSAAWEMGDRETPAVDMVEHQLGETYIDKIDEQMARQAMTAPNVEAKGAPEQLLTVQDDDGYQIETRNPDDRENPHAVRWTRDDVVERRVAEAVNIATAEAREEYVTLAAILGAVGAESMLETVRRVVAERDAAMEDVGEWRARAESAKRELAEQIEAKEAAYDRLRKVSEAIKGDVR